eukprot:CAMPEP_0198236242 /NCGR_PEP_ID=MMETSP1446-20131203/2143_1 /TAXON_ID=1461542 ORGANISM="Unidentified sp, Strain CCMP2111" /NCGR_SAMPLE_ID=MMETSP1446 /ASSEMBLY_ACC=CAM_ASM_001112 /LENGTH=116 /DNA_ID=CAMNT_0043917895 /DNA_START=171 /DNA_END=521 /DNA_ORIENTATION=+
MSDPVHEEDGKSSREASRSTSNQTTGLPQSRVKKAAAEMTNFPLNTEVTFAMTRATELFLEKLVENVPVRPREDQEDQMELHYDDLAEYVEDKKHLRFLLDIIPCRCLLDSVLPGK